MDLKHQNTITTNNIKNGGAKIKKPNNKYLGVRQRPSGKWVAEIKNTTNKIRMWLGTFNTAEEAARAYDEAACLLRGSNTRTNFSPNLASPPESPLSPKIRSLLIEKKRTSSARSKKNKSVLDADSDSGSISKTVYKPHDHELSTLSSIYYQEMEMLQVQEIDDRVEMSEFELMRVERQISASLYAMNGVNEYLESAYLSSDAIWDFPDSLGHLFCPTTY